MVKQMPLAAVALASLSVSAQIIGSSDLKRAATKVPRSNFQGSSIGHTAHTLNKRLYALSEPENGTKVRRCEDLLLEEVHAIQKEIMSASHPDFQRMYEETNDNRRYKISGVAELQTKFAQEHSIAADNSELLAVLRDSKCRESVMWYIHHLRDEEKQQLQAVGFQLPLLPELVVQPNAELLEQKPEVKTIYRAYEDSLECSTCHSQHTDFVWPSDSGMNKRTGEKIRSWPDAFDVEFNLEVITESGQPGLPNIDNVTNNHFYYSYDRSNPQNSHALNRHETCPFFHTKSCDIHHDPDGIFLHINPGKFGSLCCKFQAVEVVPPYWTTWGRYVATYEKGDPISGGQADNWEGYRIDRYIFGDPVQLDEHDLNVRADDPEALVRFHATLPPPNAHSHGYWHVMEDMNVKAQDPKVFKRPALCLPSCGVASSELADSQNSQHPMMAWTQLADQSAFAGVHELMKAQQDIVV